MSFQVSALHYAPGKLEVKIQLSSKKKFKFKLKSNPFMKNGNGIRNKKGHHFNTNEQFLILIVFIRFNQSG